MDCCGSPDHNTDHSEHAPNAAQTKIPGFLLSRWIIGFVAALLLIYLFARVLISSESFK